MAGGSRGKTLAQKGLLIPTKGGTKEQANKQAKPT
jgi:hypothetical protein